MKNIWETLLILVLFSQCAIDRTIESISTPEIATFEKFKKLESQSRAQISEEGEPGQKLWLCLTFVSKENNEPLIHQRVKIYHTSAKGEYEPSDLNDESTARLNGYAITNEKGRIFVKTILPGDYGSSDDNRHIHTTVEHAKPEAYDIHFKQYTGSIDKNFIAGSDQHFLAELKKYSDEILIAFLTIEVKNPK